jgi:hypothetical protein
MGRDSVDTLSLEPQFTLIQRDKAGDKIKDSGFPRAIWPDQPGHLARTNGKGCAIYYDVPPKGSAQITGLQ